MSNSSHLKMKQLRWRSFSVIWQKPNACSLLHLWLFSMFTEAIGITIFTQKKECSLRHLFHFLSLHSVPCNFRKRYGFQDQCTDIQPLNIALPSVQHCNRFRVNGILFLFKCFHKLAQDISFVSLKKVDEVF